MFRFLKKHPFAVEAFFERSLVLTFAVPKEQILHLIPECLTLDTFQDKWAFIAVAMVQTKRLRPKGLPEFLGNDFFLMGYRIFVQYHTHAGKRLRGLYILKSETDKKRMQYFGNTFTHYRYSTIDITHIQNGPVEVIKSDRSKIEVVIEPDSDIVELPVGSPFADWKEARRFAGPLPFTFTYIEDDKEVVIVEGVRQNWHPEPVKIASCKFGFLDQLNIQSMILANAFEIRNIPYYWKKGKIEKWK